MLPSLYKDWGLQIFPDSIMNTYTDRVMRQHVQVSNYRSIAITSFIWQLLQLLILLFCSVSCTACIQDTFHTLQQMKWCSASDPCGYTLPVWTHSTVHVNTIHDLHCTYSSHIRQPASSQLLGNGLQVRDVVQVFISQHPAHLYILQDHLQDIMMLHNGTTVPMWLSETLCQQPADTNH